MPSPLSLAEREAIEAAVRHWLETVVLGLNLCPFAAKPSQQGLVRYSVSEADEQKSLLAHLAQECERLDATPASELETTLVIVPQLLQDFMEYNQFLDRVDRLLYTGGWRGVYQVASFHPQYQFAGTAPEDAENLTNRAPYPLLHIIREDSLDAALDYYPDADKIPENNIRRMNALTEQQKRQLFPYLFPTID